MIDSPFATKPTLLGDRVVLRPPTADDAPALLELLRDPEICRLTGTRAAREPTMDGLAEWYATRADHADRLDLAIVEKTGGTYVGDVEGTRRDAVCWDGQWVDAHVMSLLADEWAKHQGRPTA